MLKLYQQLLRYSKIKDGGVVSKSARRAIRQFIQEQQILDQEDQLRKK